MTLRDEDVGRIGEYAKPWLGELFDRMVLREEPTGVGGLLLECIVWVEEELKAQRELMDERFGFIERRFEDMIAHFDKRFETVDKRFFNTLTWMIGVGLVVFTSLTAVFALLA